MIQCVIISDCDPSIELVRLSLFNIIIKLIESWDRSITYSCYIVGESDVIHRKSISQKYSIVFLRQFSRYKELLGINLQLWSLWGILFDSIIHQIIMILIAIILVLLICAFEFVNWFHDTANAVATVIYTKTLKAKTAVLYSAVMNFAGIVVSTTIWLWVAYKIYELVPRHQIEATSTGVSRVGVILVIAIVMSSLIRNLVTRRYKIPSSSTHALIASIVWASIAIAQLSGTTLTIFSLELNEILISLLISPVIGAFGWYVLYRIFKYFIHQKSIFHAPGDKEPPRWIKHLLIFTCGFVSFSHGANDGQKWLGMIMIVLVVTGITTVQSEFVIPLWAIILVPTVLWIGTMVGWKRIVKTVGTKIGTHDMTYAQWASAELVAATTIGMASIWWLPVSTTHVLSSAVMWSMATKDVNDINWVTMRHIWLTWLFTIPICGILSFGLVVLLSLMI